MELTHKQLADQQGDNPICGYGQVIIDPNSLVFKLAVIFANLKVQPALSELIRFDPVNHMDYQA